MEMKITLCFILVTICVTATFARPPGNVVEMKEDDTADIIADVKHDTKLVDDVKHDTKLVSDVKHDTKLKVKPIDTVGSDKQEMPKKEKPELSLPADTPKKVLSLDDIQPPDHLDAVKLERDGMVNQEYKKEIFLGNHEEIEDDSMQMAESKLKDIFAKVDKDADGKLCLPEVEGWILDKTQEHFDEALQENDHVFKHMDPDGDGLVDWKEYYVHFLLAKGYPLKKAAKHVVDYEEIDLGYEEREALIKYKFKWTDADTNPMDNKLSKEEFLAFRHPEQSDQALNNMLNTIVEALDKDDDGILTEKEFVTLPLGDIDDEEQKKLDRDWVEERSNEFRKQIDKDHNGKVTKDELKRYLDPRNPDQAKTDGQSLIEMMDNNDDKCITWEEVLDHKDAFIQSKVVNIKRILHDEF